MLIRAGVRPFALARNPDRLAADVRSEVDVVEVDQFDADAVVLATAGVDSLHWVDPPAGSADPLVDYGRATTNVARAVTENGIGHVVFQSSVGAEKRQGVGEIDGLAATEAALDETPSAVTHLRCVAERARRLSRCRFAVGQRRSQRSRRRGRRHARRRLLVLR
ncbi:SDR family oxidoreductase [Prescottella soli]